MNMDPENKEYFANHKILHSFKGKIVLESENEQFSEDFHQQFLSLIDRIEGNLLLTFVDVKHYENNFSKRCAQILSRKLRRGEKVFLMGISKTFIGDAYEILRNLFIYDTNNKLMNLFALSTNPRNSKQRHYSLWLPKTNSGADTETMIAMLDGDRFAEEKQCLVNVLPLVKAAELRDGVRNIEGNNCGAWENSCDYRIRFGMGEPTWCNCVGCALE